MANLPLSWGKPTIFIKDLGTSSAKWKKLATVKSGSTVKYVDKTVKKGKTYYVRIRAYDAQTKSWGAWSAPKKVKAKK